MKLKCLTSSMVSRRIQKETKKIPAKAHRRGKEKKRKGKRIRISRSVPESITSTEKKMEREQVT